MHALQVLEYSAILERLAQSCETAMGADAALLVLPDFEPHEVWRGLDETDQAAQLVDRFPPPSLHGVRDLREAMRRARKGGDLGGIELFRAGMALRCMGEFARYIEGKKDVAPSLWEMALGIPSLPALERKLTTSLDADGEVLDSASPLLSDLRRRKLAAASRIVERIQSYVSKHRDLLSDPLYTVRDGRYVIPLKSENRGKVPGIVHDTSSSGQTLFVEPQPVVELGNALREAEAAEREEVRRILLALSREVGQHAEEIAYGIGRIGDLDLRFAKARLGHQMGGTMPERASGSWIEIEGGRHPMLRKEEAVPLDIHVGRDRPCLLITGPNTGGKTVSIKTVGLFVLMAQSGMMVPARHVRLGPFTQVWADIGDEQSLAQSLSTFSAHLKNIAQAIKELKPGALVLLDEIGAGTDPAEGAALAKAILSHLRDHGARVLASTHYGELKAFAYEAEGFANASMEFDVKTLRPTYRLLMGSPGASHALRIAERYGIPKSVVDAAHEGLGTTQQEVSRMLEELETAQRQARRAQGEADRLAARLRDLESSAESKLDEAKEAKRKANEAARNALQETLRELRLEANRIFDTLKAAAGPKAAQQAREDFKVLHAMGEEALAAFEVEEPTRTKPAEPVALTKGDSVHIEGYGKVGVLLETPSGKTASVQIGPLKMQVALDKLRPTQPADMPKTSSAARMALGRAMASSTEIHLRNMRYEDAQLQLDKFLDDAVLGGLQTVRIVHGKGEGILRKMAHSALKRHKGVKSFREADANEGGQGVTIATLA